MQHLLSAGKLLDEHGHLCEAGYATSLVKEYDRRDIRAAAHRIKEWDYYLVYNNDFGVALTIDDNSYMGLLSASFLDFKSRREVTVSPIKPLTFGSTHFPSTSVTGDIKASCKGAEFSFDVFPDKRVLKCHFDKFSNEEFTANIELTDFPRDSMVIATPFSEDKKAFYYNQKIIGTRASGTVMFEGKQYEFSPDDSFGLLDWGRGVWTYDNTWYWGAAQGIIDSHKFGFNIGYGFGDTSKASENMLFYDGIAHKIGRLTFDMKHNEYGSIDFMAPYGIVSDDGRFDVTLTPILDRSAYTSIGIVLSDQHQVFGHFTGKAVLDDGTMVSFENLLGFAEKVRNKW